VSQWCYGNGLQNLTRNSAKRLAAGLYLQSLRKLTELSQLDYTEAASLQGWENKEEKGERERGGDEGTRCGGQGRDVMTPSNNFANGALEV